jgi:hypothetical protein
MRASERIAATLLQGQLQRAGSTTNSTANHTASNSNSSSGPAAAGLQVLGGLGLQQSSSLATATAAAADTGVSIAIDVAHGGSAAADVTATAPSAAAGAEQQQAGLRPAGGSFSSLTAARARGLLPRGSFGQLGELAQRLTSQVGSAAGPAGAAAAAQLQRLLDNSSSSGIGGLLSSSSSSSGNAMRGQVSARVWLLVGYVSVLHLCLMVAFTSKAAPASLSPAELLKLCGGGGGGGAAAAAAAGVAAGVDPRANALP